LLQFFVLHNILDSHISDFKYLFKSAIMGFNKISGVVRSSSNSTILLPFLYTILHKLNFVLNSTSHQQHLALQAQTVWEVLACKRPDAQTYSLANARKIIASDIVAIVEQYKNIRFEYTMKWPASPFTESVWTVLGQSMEWGILYSCRNSCSHNFGVKDVTAEEENKMFEMVVKHYKMLLPLVEGLVNKLEAAVEDEAAWDGSVQELNARYLALEEGVPWYSEDCEAVQLQIVLQQERLQAMFAATEADRKGQEEEVWVQVEVSGAQEWGFQGSEGLQEAVSWGCSYEEDEGYEDDDTSTICGNHTMEYTSPGKNDLRHESKILSSSGLRINWDAVRDTFGPINPLVARRIARMSHSLQ
jgi:hypothetical protein